MFHYFGMAKSIKTEVNYLARRLFSFIDNFLISDQILTVFALEITPEEYSRLSKILHLGRAGGWVDRRSGAFKN